VAPRAAVRASRAVRAVVVRAAAGSAAVLAAAAGAVAAMEALTTRTVLEVACGNCDHYFSSNIKHMAADVLMMKLLRVRLVVGDDGWD
jgi:hypothetical protein